MTCGNSVPTNHTFGDLIAKLRPSIEENFGEEVVFDINHLNRIRNLESHPTRLLPEVGDLLNIVGKACTFLKLFNNHIVED